MKIFRFVALTIAAVFFGSLILCSSAYSCGDATKNESGKKSMPVSRNGEFKKACDQRFSTNNKESSSNGSRLNMAVSVSDSAKNGAGVKSAKLVSKDGKVYGSVSFNREGKNNGHRHGSSGKQNKVEFTDVKEEDIKSVALDYSDSKLQFKVTKNDGTVATFDAPAKGKAASSETDAKKNGNNHHKNNNQQPGNNSGTNENDQQSGNNAGTNDDDQQSGDNTGTGGDTQQPGDDTGTGDDTQQPGDNTTQDPDTTIPPAGAKPSIYSHKASGLIESFPDNADADMAGQANTYDQALAAEYFIKTGKYAQAKKIFDAYNKISDAEVALGYKAGNFSQFYNAETGAYAQGAQWTGDNAWLGIAILDYSKATNDKTYMALAQKIAGTLLEKLAANKPGETGIIQALGSTIKSTEENIDAYVFLKQLGEETGETKYTDAANNIYSFIKSAYNQTNNCFDCGENDPLYGNEMQARAMATFGKAGLEAMGIDVDKFIATVEANGKVTTTYTKPSGETVNVTGFGFTKNDDKVSVEWTAQMIIGYLVLADDYKKAGDQTKADTYKQKATFYINELSKMADANGNMPYSSKQGAAIVADWNWYTPKSSQSLSATSYYQLAIAGDNPYTLAVEHLWE